MIGPIVLPPGWQSLGSSLLVLVGGVLVVLWIRRGAGRTSTQLLRSSRLLDLTKHELERKVHELERVNAHLEKAREKMRQAVDEVRTLNLRTTQEAHKLNIVLSLMGEGLLAVDYDRKIVLMNQAAAALLRLAPGEGVGRSVDVVLPLFVGGHRIPAPLSPVERAIQEQTIVRSKMEDNYTCRRKSGDVFPVALTITAFLGKGDIAAVVIFRDISNEKAIDKAKTEFVSLASHQLRTPVSVINWYSEMLLNEEVGKINRDQQRYLHEIYQGSQRMADLVNALLNVSRIELGTFSVEPGTVHLGEIAHAIVDELDPEIKKKNLRVVEKYRRIPRMQADPKLIRIIFENLLTNAVRYTPEKGKVTVVVAPRKDMVVISVSDTGYGIPALQQERIFTKLFRADNVKQRETSGTGLGLYLVKSIVERVGGKIWFSSKENKGTTFYVELPKLGMTERHGSPRVG